MANQVFNEADQFLIQRWKEAKNLADSMKKVREKYRMSLQRVIQQLREHHKDLDVFKEYFTQAWASGSLVFGRKAWAGAESEVPDGLWLDYLHLDYLTSEKEEEPWAYIWVNGARKAGIDVASAKRNLSEQLPTLLTPEERKRCLDENEVDVLIAWRFSSKREILDWLLAGDIERLSQCIHEQVAIFARLVPLLDDVLRPK